MTDRVLLFPVSRIYRTLPANHQGKDQQPNRGKKKGEKHKKGFQMEDQTEYLIR